MRAAHHIFTTESQAYAAMRRFKRRGVAASAPWQDDHGNWRVTVLLYGQ